jgi:hypothetical protein
VSSETTTPRGVKIRRDLLSLAVGLLGILVGGRLLVLSGPRHPAWLLVPLAAGFLLGMGAHRWATTTRREVVVAVAIVVLVGANWVLKPHG